MLILDHRPFQARVHGLLDDTRGRRTDFATFCMAVQAAVREHRIPVDAELFADRLATMVAAGDRPRAHACIEAMGEKGFTHLGQALCMFLRVVNHTLFLVFCLVFVGKCGLAAMENLR